MIETRFFRSKEGFLVYIALDFQPIRWNDAKTWFLIASTVVACLTAKV